MKPRGINRIVLAVRDIEDAKALYSTMLGATFYDASWTGEPFGINVAISWDAGIELCAPRPGRERDSIVSRFLDEHGDGILKIVFDVQDADTAKAQAEKCGLHGMHSVDYSQADIDAHLDGLFKRYKEHFMDSGERCGFAFTFAQIEPK